MAEISFLLIGSIDSGVILRPAAPADLPAIAAIQALSPEASSWNPLDYDCQVAIADARVAAFVVTRRSAPRECEILNLAVHPQSRRRGIASALVRGALQQTPGEWFLEVRESNSAAIAFYKSLGFNPCGRRPEYYHDPAEAAIVMRFFS